MTQAVSEQESNSKSKLEKVYTELVTVGYLSFLCHLHRPDKRQGRFHLLIIMTFSVSKNSVRQPNDVKKKKVNSSPGLDSAHALGVQKTISASELADPKVDHLTVMTYVALFKKVTPRLPKAQKCRVETRLEETTVGQEVSDLERGEGRGQGGQGGKKTTLGD